jgi:TonB-dependent receptor
MKFQLKLTFFLLINALFSFSQTGVIKGKVFDAETGEMLPGSKITLVGQNKGATCNMDGSYVISQLNAGTYQINVTSFTYSNKAITDIEVKDKDTVVLDISLTKGATEMGTVTVTFKVEKESVENILTLQRNSVSALDAISSQDMKTKPDPKVSDVLKRVTGASVQDNKFVVVRGLSDRYNFAFINGAALPSTESDRKAFAFDIFPSNMLDNLIIYKTGTPDMPGEFAGGIIDINTTEPKDKDFQSLQIGGSYNAITTFKNFMTYESSFMDVFGLGAQSRAIPDGIPTTETFASIDKDEKGELAKKMNFSWSGKNRLALPNLSLQYTIGKNYKFSENNERSFGWVFAYSYQNNLSFSKITRRDYEEQATEVVLKTELEDSAYTQSVMNSAMFNSLFKINNKNKIQLKQMYSINSDDRFNVRRGAREFDNDPRQFERSNNIWYTQNNIYTAQLLGNHDLKIGKINWNLGYSNVQRDIPNLRRVVYRKYATFEEDSTQQYVAVVQNNGTIPTAAGNMFWATSAENIASAKYDYSRNIELGKTKHEIKLGGFHQIRNRDFVSRNFGFSQYKPTNGSFNSLVLLQPEDSIFQSGNLGLISTGLGGFKLEEASNVDDSYQAFSFLNAGYVMANSQLHEKFKVVYGARLESYNQQFNYIEFGSNLAKNLDTTVNDILPSVNVIFSPTKRINLRLAYFKTVSRPEFRELAPFAFYNFIQDNILSGNPQLQRATINNYDVRFEYFPGKNQIISVSGFYKELFNPIELINRTGTSGAPELYYTNVPKVTNFGGEMEYRINFGFLSKKDTSDTNLWSGLNAYTNLSLIRSNVDLSQVVGSGDSRPLQGQSPYIINAGLSYAHPTQDWSVTASYNIVGQRIYIVGNVQEPSVWENGRHVVDFQIAKTFKEKWELKLNIKDLLAQDLVFFQDLNGNQKFDNDKSGNTADFDPNNPTSNDKFMKGPDNVWQEIQFGQTVSLSLKYNFGL